jgi:glutamate synthase (NADPH) large chain
MESIKINDLACNDLPWKVIYDTGPLHPVRLLCRGLYLWRHQGPRWSGAASTFPIRKRRSRRVRFSSSPVISQRISSRISAAAAASASGSAPIAPSAPIATPTPALTWSTRQQPPPVPSVAGATTWKSGPHPRHHTGRADFPDDRPEPRCPAPHLRLPGAPGTHPAGPKAALHQSGPTANWFQNGHTPPVRWIYPVIIGDMSIGALSWRMWEAVAMAVAYLNEECGLPVRMCSGEGGMPVAC